jgi:hypothetical protein
MPRSVNKQNQEYHELRVPGDLKAAFEAAAASVDQPAEKAIETLMRSYIEEHQKPESGYEEWFRAQVQAGADDPRPGIPHDDVMQKAKSLLESLSAEKLAR